jgi:galacturonokinase
MDIDQLIDETVRHYGCNPGDVRVVRSPYRICPMGAHIDHQLGPVTAMAIDRAVYLAFAPSNDNRVRLRSLTFGGEIDFEIDAVPARHEDDWGNYARGAVEAIKSKHTLSHGIVGVTTGQISEGGLSSSAAVGCAYLLALEAANDLHVSAEDNIELDRLIENEYLGLRNGILDQSAILLSRNRHLTVIDCATVTHELIPQADAMPDYSILVAFSGVKQALVSTGYNQRVDECAAAAGDLLRAAGRESRALLGEVTPQEYADHRGVLNGDPAKRAEHFFTERDRVRQGIETWRAGDIGGFGRLISESGRSSIENYECGSEPLIDLYHILVETDGVHGARFSGAGFRGCSIALCDPAKAEAAAESVASRYRQKHPERADNDGVLIARPADGAGIL